jgi:hypothetical protein
MIDFNPKNYTNYVFIHRFRVLTRGRVCLERKVIGLWPAEIAGYTTGANLDVHSQEFILPTIIPF